MIEARLERDVFGQPVLEPFTFTLVREAGILRFAPWFPASSETVPGAAPGSFFEGLWEGDVAELFLRDADGGYTEYNFAPNRAWWAQRFSAPRVRRTGAVPKEIVAPSGELVGNVTAVIGGRFLSYFPLGGEQPDFHRPQDFRAFAL